MSAGIARLVFVAACFALLCGCAALDRIRLDRRLGLGPGAAAQPVDPAVRQEMDRRFARGAQALARGDLEAAIAAWRQYAAIAPAHAPQARKVRGYLTLLEREAAKRYAAQAVADERAGRYAATDRLHVAVFPLQSRGPNAARDAFNRAVVAMITADLSQVPQLTLLERERIDAVLRERRLDASGLVDASTAAASGRVLGAGTVVAGAVTNEPDPAGPGSGHYAIATAVSDVTQARVAGTQQAEGRQDEFWRLEKEIVHGILDTLGVRPIPPAVERIHTRSWAAYARFAAGLSLLAQERWDEARRAFYAALALDPGFDLAADAFLATPERSQTPDEIGAELSARASPGCRSCAPAD